MELTLSHDSAINTTLDSATGKTLYSISTPSRWPRSTTTVTKCTLDGDGDSEGEAVEIARIHWHKTHSSRLVYDGKILDIDKFMPANITRT
jgi:hypothetical protein